MFTEILYHLVKLFLFLLFKLVAIRDLQKVALGTIGDFFAVLSFALVVIGPIGILRALALRT